MTRLPCCVPYCGRTTGEPYSEWVCGKHWRAVPAVLKARRNRWRRLARKAMQRGRDLPMIRAKADAAWLACRNAAIEIAMGLS